jgi:hypothetical protein
MYVYLIMSSIHISITHYGIHLQLIFNIDFIATLALGSQPMQRLARMRTKKETQESHFMLTGVQKSVREWTFTIPRELPL